jgi:hypothetical protein
LNWRFVAHGLGTAAVVTAFAVGAYGRIRFSLFDAPSYLWIDAHIYFRATQAWLAGANPWQSTALDIPFGAPPPALLLNLPLVAFGEGFATVFWVVANTASAIFLVRRLHLPIWWLLYQPIIEAWLGGSPDLTLSALVLLGVSGPAALAKPYSISALIADRRWRPIAGAVVVGAATIPFLPWQTFFASQADISAAFARWGDPVSAVGDPLLMGITLLALLSLGWRRGWMLAIPGLLAMQPHYLLFALPVLSGSRLLAASTTFAVPHLAAGGVVFYAIIERCRQVLDRLRGATPGKVGAHRALPDGNPA